MKSSNDRRPATCLETRPRRAAGQALSLGYPHEQSHSMAKNELRFEEMAYPFWLGSHCAGAIADHLAGMVASSLHVITDHTVNALHVKSFVRQLYTDCPIRVWSIPEGEENKTLTTLETLANQLLSVGVDRNSVIVAMGGGVVGNLAGLLAALLFRGIRLVHIPTTLLAMSDSVVSHKQAVNMPQGKNLLGCYHMPEAVFADTAFLMTLPARHIRSGLCEIIKNVLIIEAQEASPLAQALNPDAQYHEDALIRIVRSGVRAKQKIMIHDRREKRQALAFEYGHTVGHAIELACAGRLTHGESVALGMILAAEIASALGVLSAKAYDWHYRLLRLNGVDLRAPAGTTAEAVMKMLLSDNKRGYLRTAANEVPMILLQDMGVPLLNNEGIPLTPVSVDLIETLLRKHLLHPC
ncbi:2-deoxy-scyllo-inosose synthase [Sodalis endosymbiont of Spalangia cameroni]|uniref:2-deoxy-scyllo-inosose synthase n=1 Tax=Sodalis praecaptivus TaxID=1239307 RepID=UPI0031F9300E